MKHILIKIFYKFKEFNDSLTDPCDFILIEAIMEHLDRNPYTIQELNELLNINNKSRINSILDELIRDNLIKKTNFTMEVNGSVISSSLYYSLSYENKFLDALQEKSMTIPDLYQELDCTDEFKIMAMIGKLEPENKVELEEWPEGIKTICRDEVINLAKYKRTKSAQIRQKE